jgi:hypothetical protein
MAAENHIQNLKNYLGFTDRSRAVLLPDRDPGERAR